MKDASSTVAKSGDGSVQINFIIPLDLIKKSQDEVVRELAADIEIPGFRKGKAPLDKIREKIPQNSLLEHTLGRILPKALGDAITKHKIKPAIYPKFEVIKAKEDEDWEIRGVTAELPEIELGDYKKAIRVVGQASHSAKASRDDKNQIVIKTLLETIKITIPKLLIDEEANARLSGLLARIEKLGLSLESYLPSIGKTAESLRQDYEKQARETITLDLGLNEIVEKEGISVEEKEIDEAIKVSGTNPEQRSLVKGILARRKALDYLSSLV